MNIYSVYGNSSIWRYLFFSLEEGIICKGISSFPLTTQIFWNRTLGFLFPLLRLFHSQAQWTIFYKTGFLTRLTLVKFSLSANTYCITSGREIKVKQNRLSCPCVKTATKLSGLIFVMFLVFLSQIFEKYSLPANDWLGRKLRGHILMKQRTLVFLKHSCDQMLGKCTVGFLNIVLAMKYIHT